MIRHMLIVLLAAIALLSIGCNDGHKGRPVGSLANPQPPTPEDTCDGFITLEDGDCFRLGEGVITQIRDGEEVACFEFDVSELETTDGLLLGISKTSDTLILVRITDEGKTIFGQSTDDSFNLETGLDLPLDRLEALTFFFGVEVCYREVVDCCIITDVDGSSAPPSYCLRLDGFCEQQNFKRWTFGNVDLKLFTFADGGLLLTGCIRVVEFNGYSGYQLEEIGVDFEFQVCVFLSPEEVPEGEDPEYQYFCIDPHGYELVSKDNEEQFVHLISKANGDGVKFVMGYQAIGGKSILGGLSAKGWVNYEHHYGEAVFGDLSEHRYSSDFLFDITCESE